MMSMGSMAHIDKFLDAATEIAKMSSCERSRCGSVVVQGQRIIGKGFNSPPREMESQRRCHIKKDTYDKKVTDKTCCVHAEQRAMIDALLHHPGEIEDADLYFIRLSEAGTPKEAGKPYCTICSKMALDFGIARFALFQEGEWKFYDTKDYNDLSYGYEV